MYFRMMLSEAAPQDTAKYDGDQKWPCIIQSAGGVALGRDVRGADAAVDAVRDR
jgi:hypothetical protein